MSMTKLIREQTKMLDNLEKRFAEKLTVTKLQGRLNTATRQQEERIEGRIKALQAERAKAVKHFDAVIKAEQTALDDLRTRHLDQVVQMKAATGKTAARKTRAAASTRAKSAASGAQPRGGAKKGGSAASKPKSGS